MKLSTFIIAYILTTIKQSGQNQTACKGHFQPMKQVILKIMQSGDRILHKLQITKLLQFVKK